MVDYQHKKGNVILKDTSSVFTMIDWIRNSNWAILHFVSNNETGNESRIEEQYSLIDLKRNKIVNTELKKCTGNSPAFQTIEKDENGKIFCIYSGQQ